MSTYIIEQPATTFCDQNGNPLDGGYIYIGQEGANPETNPVAIYLDEAMTIPIAQPVRTAAGYLSLSGAARSIYTAQKYSITIRDKYKSLLFTTLSWSGASDLLRSQLAASGSASLIGDAQQIIAVGKIPKFGDVSGIPTLNIPSTNGQRLFIEKQVTTADDLTTLQLHRNATYTGGTNGYVGSALLVQTDVAATANGTFEWAGLFVINNLSPNTQNSENVAIYAQGNKKSTGRTWAGCLEITDSYNGSGSTVSSNEATIGLEITCRGSGLDNATTPQRMGLHVAITSNDAGEWGNGVIVGTDANSFWRYGVNVTGRGNNSAFHASVTTNTSSNCALLRDESTALTLGVDTSGAVYSSGFAMRMALGQKIALDVNGTNAIYATSSGIVLNTVVNMSASFAIPSANRSTTATAGGVASLPATASGFINFKMDGTTYKIPYYAA